MAEILLPVLYTLFVWWFSTGVILYLDGLPRSTFKWTLGAGTLLLVLAFAGLHETADDTRVTGAYLAFTAALVVWGWVELTFLLGIVTGPRRQACPPLARGWRRARHAVMAILWHELALLGLGAVVIALCWGQPNPVGAWTYATLYLMRLSAKLNVFLGVRNLNEQFLPEHLRYLGSYFRQRPMNALFPPVVVISSVIAIGLWQATVNGAGAFETTALSFVATLLSLAILEHLFMVLPLPSEWLWQWGLRSRPAPAPLE